MSDNHSTPLFSIVIPAYNAQRFLPLTLESIFRQTVGDYEIVVVNDGSTDGTLEMLQGISDPRLRVITQENGGECAARNRGIKEARGKYVAFLDADDAWCPNHLEIVLDRIHRHGDISWFVTPTQKVPDIEPKDFTPAQDRGCTITSWYLEANDIPASSSTVLTRELAQAIPDLFPVGVKMFGDNIGWAKLAKICDRVAIIDAPTVLYRFWQGNASTVNNVCRHGVRSEAVKTALAKHAELYREPDCKPEAKLYFRRFALGNWRVCISSAFPPDEWQADFAARKDVVGRISTCWMRASVLLNRLSLCAMRWGVRMHKEAVERKMRRMAVTRKISCK